MLLIGCLIAGRALLFIACGAFLFVFSLVGLFTLCLILSCALLLIGSLILSLIAGAALVLVGRLALLLVSSLVGGLTLLLIAGIAFGLKTIFLEVRAHLPVDGGALLGIHGLADLLVAPGALVLVGCLVNRLVNSSAFWGVTTMDT